MKMNLTISSLLLFISTLSFGQWTLANMSEGKTAVTPVKFGNKLLIVGGKTASNGASTSTAEIFDATTNTWSTQNISFYNGSNFSSTVTGDWAVFGKSATGVVGNLFVYENVGGTWETVSMPDTRNDYILASVGHKVMLAGGKIFGQATNKINVYNLETKEWSLDSFAVTRTGMRSITIGEQVFFVGGSAGNTGYSSQVDVYNNANNTWTTINLTQGRTNVSLALINDKLIVAGGQPSSSLTLFSDVVEYIDVNTLQVASGTLPDDVTNMRSAVIGNQMVLWGNNYPLAYIFDAGTGQWTTYNLTPGLSQPGYSTGAILGNKLYFAGGNQIVASDQTVFIYDGQTHQWTTDVLPNQRTESRAVAIANKVLFAGGVNFSGNYASSIVDIYTDASILPLAIQGADIQNTSCPGSSDGQIIVEVIGGAAPYTYSWMPSNVEGPSPSGLAEGTYTVTIEDANGVTLTSTYEVTAPDQFVVTTDSTSALGSNSDGSAVVMVTGGTPPYSYVWSDPASTMMMELMNVPAGIYSVTISDSNACTMVVNVTVNMFTATHEGYSNSFDIVPTLSTSHFTVNSLAPTSNFNISLIDVHGRIVENWTNVASGEELQVLYITPGLYMVHIESHDGLSTVKRIQIQ